jgi:hypothetical protein
MSKLTLDALKQRADAIASDDLLEQISGGTANACHDGPEPPRHEQPIDNTRVHIPRHPGL